MPERSILCENQAESVIDNKGKTAGTKKNNGHQFSYDMYSDIEFINNYFDKFDEQTIQPYASTNAPDIHSEYFSRIDEINAYRSKAVKMVLESGHCDKAVISELNSKSTLQQLQFFVVCENQERFFFTEQQIKQNTPVKTQKQLAWTKENSIDACRHYIESQVAGKPGELDLHSFTGLAFNKHEKSGITKVRYDFDFTNLLGIEAQYSAHCLFRPGQTGEYEISVRH